MLHKLRASSQPARRPKAKRGPSRACMSAAALPIGGDTPRRYACATSLRQNDTTRNPRREPALTALRVAHWPRLAAYSAIGGAGGGGMGVELDSLYCWSCAVGLSEM